MIIDVRLANSNTILKWETQRLFLVHSGNELDALNFPLEIPIEMFVPKGQPHFDVLTSSLELPHRLNFVEQKLQLIVINLDETVASLSH